MTWAILLLCVGWVFASLAFAGAWALVGWGAQRRLDRIESARVKYGLVHPSWEETGPEEAHRQGQEGQAAQAFHNLEMCGVPIVEPPIEPPNERVTDLQLLHRWAWPVREPTFDLVHGRATMHPKEPDEYVEWCHDAIEKVTEEQLRGEPRTFLGIPVVEHPEWPADRPPEMRSGDQRIVLGDEAARRKGE